jgi:hypothetical protein
LPYDFVDEAFFQERFDSFWGFHGRLFARPWRSTMVRAYRFYAIRMREIGDMPQGKHRVPRFRWAGDGRLGGGRKKTGGAIRRHRLEDGIPKEEEEKPRKPMLIQKMVRRNGSATI